MLYKMNPELISGAKFDALYSRAALGNGFLRHNTYDAGMYRVIVFKLEGCLITGNLYFNIYTKTLLDDTEYEGFSNMATFIIWRHVMDTRDAHFWLVDAVKEGRSDDLIQATMIVHLHHKYGKWSEQYFVDNMNNAGTGLLAVNWHEFISWYRGEYAPGVAYMEHIEYTK